MDHALRSRFIDVGDRLLKRFAHLRGILVFKGLHNLLCRCFHGGLDVGIAQPSLFALLCPLDRRLVLPQRLLLEKK